MPENKTEIWQGNEITRAKYSYTGVEINIMCLIIYKLQYYSDSHYYQLPITCDEYIERTGLDPSNRKEIKKAVRSMMCKSFEMEDSEGNEYLFTIVSGIKFERKSGTIYINVDPFIMPYVRDISKNTTRYYLETILSLKGKNAKRLYQHVCMFKSSGQFSMHFDDIRSKLFDEPKYKFLAAFIEYVIDPAVKEINAKSNLVIKYEKVSKYGSTKMVNFTIHEKTDSAYNLYYDPKQQKCYNILVKWGISEWFAKQSVDTLPVLDIHKLGILAQKPEIKNKGAYMRKLLIENGVPERKVSK